MVWAERKTRDSRIECAGAYNSVVGESLVSNNVYKILFTLDTEVDRAPTFRVLAEWKPRLYALW